jgi:hypothetical protein
MASEIDAGVTGLPRTASECSANSFEYVSTKAFRMVARFLKWYVFADGV